MKNTSRKFEFPFVGKKKIARDTYLFRFRRTEKFDFIPGQYFKVTLQIKNPDERGSYRHFTISSPNTNKEEVQITTKILKSSFKKKLHSLKKGEKVSFFGPIGYFTLDIKNKKNKIFLAGGMGITPYRSILHSLNSNKLKTEILLIASFSEYDDVIFYDELKKIEKENPNIRIIYTLTEDPSAASSRGGQAGRGGFERGRIDEKMIRKYCAKFLRSEFFIVGPVSFEESMQDLLKKMKVAETKIFKENFPGY